MNYAQLTPAAKTMKILLSDAQLTVLKSMNQYWEEISKRENNTDIAKTELEQQLLSVLNPLQILLVCGEYAKNYIPTIGNLTTNQQKP